MTTANPEHGDAIAYVALGANLGDRERTLRSAIAALRQLGTVEAISSFYETAPVGLSGQPDFLNAVVTLQTQLPPQELMNALLHIEQQHGRDRSVSVPKGPRTLDLDLLSYDNLIMETPLLTLPHPALAERRFVLVPLAEIAPQWRHPVSGKTAAELLAELSRDDRESAQTVRKMRPPKSST
jgi:2-amino-4-hydroxy-6-hydroxymethyldihydropteridine diphosphokinase